MIFTTNKPLREWGRVLHDPDLAVAILDRVLEDTVPRRRDGASAG
jgi:DNA replication protein DnaC